MKAFIILALVGVVTAFSLRNQLKDDNKDARLKSKIFMLTQYIILIFIVLSPHDKRHNALVS